MKRILLFSLVLVLGACASSKHKSSTPNASDSKKEQSAKKAATKKAPTAAPSAKEASADLVTCRGQGEDVRMIKNISLQGGGCTVEYTKFNETKEVASAKYDLSHCSSIFDRMKENLIKSGFSCN